MPQTDPFRFAFHNVAMLVFAILCAFGMTAGYQLLSDFLKPSIWAVICGIVLFPLKRKMTSVVTEWLDRITDNSTPLLLSLLLGPIRWLRSIGDWMLDSIDSHRVPFGLLAISLPFAPYLLRLGIFQSVLMFVTKCLKGTSALVGLFPQSKLVLVVFCLYQGYLVASSMITKLQTPLLRNYYVSWTIWTFLLAFLSNYAGPLRPVVFLGFMLTSVIVSYAEEKSPKSKTNGDTKSGSQASLAEKDSDACQLEEESSLDSNTFIKWLLISCAVVYVSQHIWLASLLLLPLFVAVLKRIAVAFAIPSLIKEMTSKLAGSESSDLICPTWIHRLGTGLFKIDRKLVHYLKSSTDTGGSVAAMLLLGVGIITVSTFIVAQLYYESVHMVTLASSIANQTLADNEKFQTWIKESTNSSNINELLNQYVERLYLYGKSWISDQVRQLVDNTDKAILLEDQIFAIADKMYASWMISNNNDSQAVGEVQPTSLLSGWSDLLVTVTDNTEISTDSPTAFKVFEMLTSNFHVVWSVIETSWTILSSNAELIISGLSDMLGPIFTSGTALVDFTLDTIVFLTILFQLLCSSGDKFSPLEVLEQMSPGKSAAIQISADIESAVSGVFTVSLKMALFYGLYTWLTHTIMAVNLVFIPSLLAAILAAIPFFGPYIASIPAVLELWVVRDQPLLAVVMFLLNYIPPYIVDDVIYSEIQSTNPLLTGMSIAGGMCLWGLEGVIFGPVVLCCIFVLISLYNNIVADMRNA